MKAIQSVQGAYHSQEFQGRVSISDSPHRWKSTSSRYFIAAYLRFRIKEYSYAQAYVGGLFREQGMNVVKQWFDPLLRPLIDAAYSAERRDHLVPGSDAPTLTLQPMQQRSPSPQIDDSAKLDA